LTHGDIADRRRYLNARHTFQTLLDFSIIPIVNENDTVAVEEMNFGDNDQLSSLVATLLKADLLVILSNVDGVYDRDPQAHQDARRIPVITRIDEIKDKLVGGGVSPYGTGGISSKLSAAQKAAAGGIPTVIVNGLESAVLSRVFDPEREVGTLVIPEDNPLGHRKHWIAYNLKPVGEIVVDPGAREAVVRKGKSLLAAGLKEIRGSFKDGDCVRCLDADGREFARGLVNYSTQDLTRIKGLHSSQIEQVLGHKAYDEVIHRDNLVLT
jgi:glutamate 5-kinase